MSVQNDSNDSIFFHLVWRRSVFFSFYKLTSCPFLTISSPVPMDKLFFFLFILFHPSTPIYFYFSIVFVLCFMSLSTCVVSDVYRSLCTCGVLTILSCPCLLFFFIFIPSFFFFLWVLLRLDYKRMIQHFPSFSNACVYL